MNIDELAEKEKELYQRVCILYQQPKTVEYETSLLEIYKAYRLIHQQYAALADKDEEALKRGLFIQWYAVTEPNYLTGIEQLDQQAELAIIKALDERLEKGLVDLELQWMLDYYASWDNVFEQFKEYEALNRVINTSRKYSLPHTIDRAAMEKRGQMGEYWNSLTIFQQDKG
jgi:hypothetical protein